MGGGSWWPGCLSLLCIHTTCFSITCPKPFMIHQPSASHLYFQSTPGLLNTGQCTARDLSQHLSASSCNWWFADFFAAS
ncbi:hypothetical protein K438DRAFT_322402 [Mycena galopus ATCC 62051]|nr:hypothetical protein K438DRAFT_322402 [Mycena galopus ATCC 62051]